MILRGVSLFLFLTLLLVLPAGAQEIDPSPDDVPVEIARLLKSGPTPLRTFRIIDIAVAGVADTTTRDFVARMSGLFPGQVVTVPGDPVLADAIRAIYRIGLFENVRLVEAGREGNGVHLRIDVTEGAALAAYTLDGVKPKHRAMLEKQLPLFPGMRLRPADLDAARRTVQSYLRDEGYPLAEVTVTTTRAEDGVTARFVADRGPRAEVGRITFAGNDALPADALRKAMTETSTKSRWRFWKDAPFTAAAYASDLRRVVEYYRARGHYDARIVRDTTYIRAEGEDAETIIEITVHEGPVYRFREVEWRGHTHFSDDELTRVLGLAAGDVYDGPKIETNLFAHPQGLDVTGLYMNRGYLRIGLLPEVRVVGEGLLDLVIRVDEGEVYTFRDVDIAGNDRTREHVVRRVLQTVPGQPFSRAAVQSSLMGLAETGFFDPAALAAGPSFEVDEATKTVDLTYRVEEKPKNPLRLGASYSGGLTLQLGFEFDNFSVRDAVRPSRWKPFPVGDGQQFSVGAEVGGRAFQRYSLRFAEPWFRGKPAPLGFALSYTHIADGLALDTDGALDTWAVSVFHDRRLAPTLGLSTALRFRAYDNRDWSATLPEGQSRELVATLGLTHATLDHPAFPRRGVRLRLGLDVAPPVASFVQYHKWRLDGQAVLPLTKDRRLAFGLSADLGYLGSFTDEDPAFQRFVVGGSPLDVRGAGTVFAEDVVFLRGYPAGAIGTRQGDTVFGGQALVKVGAEMSYLAIDKRAIRVMPYAFFEAANTWDRLGDVAPTDLFRSVGFGARMQVPALGLVELSYGYNLDRFAPLGSHDGAPGWRLQLSLGQTF